MLRQCIGFLALTMTILGAVACSSSDDFALEIFGEPEAVGATVYINGKEAGELKEVAGGSTYFGIWWPKGEILIEIKQGSRVLHHERVVITENESEYYVSLDIE